MEEVKVRLEAVQALIQDSCPLRPEVLYESNYLQLRMISETIALSCLLAHEDLPGVKTKWF